MHVATYICMCTCVYVYACTCVCMYVYMYVCVCSVCVRVCVCVCSAYIYNTCSLKLKRDTWETQLEEFATTEILASNCILTAAFTVYCAPLKSHSRSAIVPYNM